LPGAYKTNGQLNAWWARHLGAYVLDAEIEMIQPILPLLTGDHIVLLGCSEQLRLLRNSTVSRKTVLNRTVPSFSTDSGICGSWDDLPLADNSLQTLVVPHTLEILLEGSKPLFHEIYRVLKPEGDLIVLGFNPSIIWRLWRFFYPSDAAIPWMDKCKKRSDLRFSLSLLDYRIVSQKTGAYCLPDDGRAITRCINWIFSGVKKICPWFGGAYILHAKKQSTGVTPIKVSWKEKYSDIKAADKVAPMPRTKVECENFEEN